MKCEFCNKDCKNLNSHRNHQRLCKSNPNRNITHLNGIKNLQTIVSIKIPCEFCNKDFNKSNIKKHKIACKSNPINIKQCPSCGNSFGTKSTTYSVSCANTFFRTGENHGNWSGNSYRNICFKYHNKICVICEEQKVLDVHHFDEDTNNNHPKNLIPLCPTHHRYWHSEFRYLIYNRVINYINQWVENNAEVN